MTGAICLASSPVMRKSLILPLSPCAGLLFIFFGLSILALEIKWARELNQQGMQGLERIVAKLKSIFGKKNKGETN